MQQQLKEGDLVYTPDGHPGVVVSNAILAPIWGCVCKVCWWFKHYQGFNELHENRERVGIFKVEQLQKRVEK